MYLQDLQLATTVANFVELTRLLPQILRQLPNDQHCDLNTEGMESLFNYDFREKKTQTMNEKGQVLKATTLDAYDKKFSNLFKIGTFLYAHTEGIAGQTHLGGFLFVQPSPNRLFEHRIQLGSLLDNIKNGDEIAYRQAKFFFDNFGLNYMKACFENATELSSQDDGILLILGDQFPSGRIGNFEAYHDYCELLEVSGNIRKYTWNAKGEKLGITGVKYIYHAAVPGFENQLLDSPDIDTFYKIYCESLAAKKPLMIHCTDGLDRAGCFAFAFHLLHNWDRIFNEKSAGDIVKNIVAEHEKIQYLRGPSFCTATNRRLLGVVQLVMMMKAVEITREILNKNDCKDYIQSLFIIEYAFNSPSYTQKLLKQILTQRANIECDYFEDFAYELPHPEITIWKIEKIIKEDATLTNNEQFKPCLEMFTVFKDNYLENGFPKGIDHRYLTDTQLIKLLITIKLLSCAEGFRTNLNLKIKVLEEKNQSNKEKFFDMMLIYFELEKMLIIKKLEIVFTKVPQHLEQKSEELKREFEVLKNKIPSSTNMYLNQLQKLKIMLDLLKTMEPTESAKSKASPRTLGLSTSLTSGLKVLRRSSGFQPRTIRRGADAVIPSGEKPTDKDSHSNEEGTNLNH